MTYDAPRQNCFILYCRGICGRFVVITMDSLLNTVKTHGYKTLKDFADNYYCKECDAAFIIALEQKLTLNEAPDPQ